MILVLCSGVDDIETVCGVETVAVAFVIVGAVTVAVAVAVDVDRVAAAGDIVLFAAF